MAEALAPSPASLLCPPCSDTVGAALWYSRAVAAEAGLAASVPSSLPHCLSLMLRSTDCGGAHVKVKGSTRRPCSAAWNGVLIGCLEVAAGAAFDVQ